ncbi:hypothetical protein Lal_00015287 [Lupinus albus]|nr:hypothetical protein Lal_00015287 [Lupinus albus]
MGQKTTTLNTLQSRNSNKLPSQTMVYPRNVSAIILRSGKKTKMPTPRTYYVLEKEHDVEASKRKNSASDAQQPFSIPLPFPPNIIQRNKMGNMEEIDMDLLDKFRKVEVNIPVLDPIKKIPSCALTRGNGNVMKGSAWEGMYPVPHILEKCKDLGTFIVPCNTSNFIFGMIGKHRVLRGSRLRERLNFLSLRSKGTSPKRRSGRLSESCNTPNLSSLKLGNSPEEWVILPDSRLSKRISPKREDQCFEFGNYGSVAQARNRSLEREKAWAGCEILA